jgi:hypothetical protein
MLHAICFKDACCPLHAVGYMLSIFHVAFRQQHAFVGSLLVAVACCWACMLLHVARYLFQRCMLSIFHAVGCMLCILHGACCLLHLVLFACCMLSTACCSGFTLHAVCCRFNVVWCMPPAAWCLFGMLHAVAPRPFCVMRVACFSGSSTMLQCCGVRFVLQCCLFLAFPSLLQPIRCAMSRLREACYLLQSSCGCCKLLLHPVSVSVSHVARCGGIQIWAPSLASVFPDHAMPIQ